MSYLGRGLEQVDNISKLDNITFNGGTTYALTKDSSAFTPISSNAILISVSGVIQQGNFSISGTNIVFDSAVASTESCDFIMHYGTGVITTPSDGSVTSAKIGADAVDGTKIADDSISDEHLDVTAITGQTEKTSLVDADKFLISDSAASGALKYVQKSNMPSGSYVYLGGINASNHNANTLRFEQVFSDNYRRYRVVGKFQGTGNGADIRFRWLKSDNVEEQSSYYNITDGSKSDSASISSEEWLDWNQQYARMFRDTATGSHIHSFEMILYPNQNENVNYPTAIFHTQTWDHNSGANRQRIIQGAIYNEITTSVAGGGMQLQSTSGLFGTVNLSIWGLKDS